MRSQVMTCERIVYDKETGEQSTAEVTVSADEGVRASTLEGVQGLRTVIEGGTITAGMHPSCLMAPQHKS